MCILFSEKRDRRAGCLQGQDGSSGWPEKGSTPVDNSQNTENDFSRGSIARNILSLALPMTLAQLINVLYSVVDRIYIGHIPHVSADALTGVGLAHHDHHCIRQSVRDGRGAALFDRERQS